MSERDFPIGHPSSPDYKGEKYSPPRAPWAADYDFDHPAAGGKNTSDLDTPDGLRKAVNERHNDLQELEAIGALPSTGTAGVNTGKIADPQDKEAMDYLASRGYSWESAREIVTRFGVGAVLKDRDEQPKH
jgi:hypothetical protein